MCSNFNPPNPDDAPVMMAADRGGPRRPLRIVIPIVLGALYGAQCLWFVGTQSLTYDEPTHLLAGLDAWRHGRFEQWNDQPPLARLWLTGSLVRGPWRLEPLAQPLNGAFWTIAISPGPEQLAWRARPWNVVLGLALAWLLWITARRMFSEGGANLALALFAFSPPLVAHFSVATVDGSATLLFFATVIVLTRWRPHPSWRATLGVGAVMGGFLIAKFSAPPLVLLGLVVMATSVTEVPRSPERLAKTAAAMVVGLIIVWAAYFFHTGEVTFRNGSLTGPYAGPHRVIVPVSRPLEVTVRLPAPEYVAAFGGVAQHSVRGQPSSFLGQVRKFGGWPLYYPVVAALKWPLVVWVIACATLVLMTRGAVPAPTDLGMMMIFPAVWFGFAMWSNLNIGDRYILPVYPFLLLMCAGFWTAVRDRRWAVPVVALMVTAHAGDCLRYAPDYLSYFNPFVRPARSYELLTDSNLDWGQGLIALRRYERAHPNDRIRLAYFGGVDPREYGIRALPLAEGERATGTIVVSATHLSGQYLEDPAAYQWLLKSPEETILNHTLHVFRVPAGGVP
jgi:hypothetical protein